LTCGCLLVPQAAANMFGYGKGELEGKNISCLMPQPFSGRHNGYLQRYTSTGEARILDSKRHVVGLHKVS
jgi:PAS domain S-box-containing protein